MKNLQILGRGQLGKGILIEQDAGYINSDDQTKQLRESIKKTGVVDPLIVYAVLQKADVENRNERVYPRELLDREAKRYMELINNHRAIGECVPAGTEIYTKNGWCNIEDMKKGDEIFTLNTTTNELEIQPVKRTTKKDYNDDMIKIYNSSSLDMLVTKKHKIVLWDRNDNPYILTAEELYDKIQKGDSKVSHSYIKSSGKWNGEEVKEFTIPNTNYTVDVRLWAKFLGIFISDGHCGGTRGGKKKNYVCITQTKEHTKQMVIDLLNQLPFEYSIGDDRQFIIYNKELYNHLVVLGNSNEKHIPQYAKEWGVELLETLFEWLLLGDGRNRKDYKGNLIREYCTVSNKLSDDVFELLLKISNGGTYVTRIPEDRYINDVKIIEEEVDNGDGTLEVVKKKIKTKRLIKAENSKPLHLIGEKRTKGIYLDTRFTKAEKVKFNDKVYCVTVDNGTWLMRYNNKISWTHNSDHPESSIISVDRISHNVTDIWWEQNTLMGKLQIIMSPGYIDQGIISCQGDQVANLIRNGIMIGVSSRGVGSLEKKDGKNYVQDDFELICWDIVTSPSTPGSWVGNTKENLEQFVENEEKKSPLLNDSLDKFLL